MPIYSYKCASCGHAKDVLQRMSDDLLTVCPACGASSFQKQLTAAGFQLKGTGWYVTDFRGGNNAPAPASEGGGGAASGGAETAAPAAPTAAPAASPAPAPAATPAKSSSTPSS